jgi:hypothetical protein
MFDAQLPSGLGVMMAVLIARKILETRIITCASPSYLARRGIRAALHLGSFTGGKTSSRSPSTGAL